MVHYRVQPGTIPIVNRQIQGSNNADEAHEIIQEELLRQKLSNRDYNENPNNQSQGKHLRSSQLKTNRSSQSQQSTASNKQMIVESISAYLRQLTSFQYNFKDDLIRLWRIVCGCRSIGALHQIKQLRAKRELYDQGVQKIAENLDLVKYLQSVNYFKLSKKIMFSKYQRRMIPFMSQNILKIQKTKINPDPIDSSKITKINKRIFKNIYSLDLKEKFEIQNKAAQDLQKQNQIIEKMDVSSEFESFGLNIQDHRKPDDTYSSLKDTLQLATQKQYYQKLFQTNSFNKQ
eukprot:403354341